MATICTCRGSSVHASVSFVTGIVKHTAVVDFASKRAAQDEISVAVAASRTVAGRSVSQKTAQKLTEVVVSAKRTAAAKSARLITARIGHLVEAFVWSTRVQASAAKQQDAQSTTSVAATALPMAVDASVSWKVATRFVR